MTILTSTAGQKDLPRYFSSVFDQAEKMSQGRLDIKLDDGRVFRAEGKRPGPAVEVSIHHPDLFARLVREGDLGFSEAYLDEQWSCSDLQAFMDLIHDDNDALFDGFPGMGLVRAYERFRHWLNSNSRDQAKKNIAHHYDLGNDFYQLWLDDTMTYSSALFDSGQESLEAAQTAKYARLVDQLAVKEGDHILEVGCGWGGFAEYAAKERGLKVTGLTISQAQHDFAVARMKAADLSDQVDIRLQDYREVTGEYDGIASIEMFEAVGERYWPVYFKTIRERLAPGARAALQIITVEEKRFEGYRKQVDFIQKYIFPGGFLPSPSALDSAARAQGLEQFGSYEFGDSYSQTLRRWYEIFNDRWDEIAAMGFDDRFRRMWNFYLTSCAGAFRGGVCDVTQVVYVDPERRSA